MTRQVEWAKRERARLIGLLGGKCVDCGTDQCLTFDCIKPTGDQHHKLSSVQRMCYYRGQFRNGNLTVRCSACNSKKGSKPAPRYLPNFIGVSDTRD